MGYPTVFATLTAGNQPLSLLDTMFTVTGQQGNITCTATGTNAISLVSKDSQYVGTSYTDGQIVSWQAAATSTGAVTMQWSGLGFLNYYTAAGVQAQSGDIVLNTNYISQYRTNLNGGAGGFITLNATVTAIANPVQGAMKNFVLQVTSNSQVTPTADELVLQNAGGGTVRLTSYAPPVTSTASTGANGLDTGSVASSTWYYWYAIYNANNTTAAGLLSTNSTTPALPAGYTYYARLGAVRTDGSSNLLRTLQKNARVQYVVGTNPATVVVAVSSNTGTFSTTSPTLAAISVTAQVPTAVARAITVMGISSLGGGTASNVLIAPNINYGGVNNGPAGTGKQAYPIYLASTTLATITANMLLEATTIGVALDNAGGGVGVMGWEDNVTN
jgi:hypothetical protein